MQYPELIEPTRKKLVAWGGPYVIENVIGAPLLDPVKLCGSMFGLHVIRHRIFESNVFMLQPSCSCQGWRIGRRDYVRPVGHGGGVKHGSSNFGEWCEGMGIDWMTRQELTQAIPPAYSRWIGQQVRQTLEGRTA